MSIFGKIKGFIGTIVNNPLKSIAISYLVYKLMKSQGTTESISENIKILKKGKKFDAIFDTNTQTYLIVAHDGSSAKGFKDQKTMLKAFPESLKAEVINNEFGGFPMEQFHKGISVETKEHPGVDPFGVAQLVFDHLKGDVNYYNKGEEKMSRIEKLHKSVCKESE